MNITHAGPGSQTAMGKGFEYACLKSLSELLGDNQNVVHEASPALTTAKNSYDQADQELRDKWDLAAKAAAKILIRLEPRLLHHEGDTPLYLSIQADAMGRAGDVRDILAIRKKDNWKIGISSKHNHDAIKHSRLSPNIDFGSEWFGVPVSQEYFDSVLPIFSELEKDREQGKLWRDVTNKSERYYVPILKAFLEELERLFENNPQESIPTRLLHYLLGRNDFYKVISNDRARETIVQGFSIYKTLNKASGKQQPQYKIKNLPMPTEFLALRFKPRSRTTIEIICDQGWAIYGRIHNASTKVEPSLKFDFKLGGLPPSVYIHREPWESNE